MKKAVQNFISRVVVPRGDRAGGTWKLLQWHKDVLGGLTDPSITQIAVSMGRGGGKTTFFALVATLYLSGILCRNRSSIVLVSNKIPVSQQLLDSVEEFIDLHPDLDLADYRVSKSSNYPFIEHKERRIKIAAHGSSSPSNLHGFAPTLILCDEPSQWSVNFGRDMYNILKTSLGKEPNSKLVALQQFFMS